MEAGRLLLQQGLRGTSLADFNRRASRFRWQEPPHIKLLCEKLEEVVATPGKNLLITMPPRHGKQVADSEPVITLRGQITHGELRVGDYVFGPDGLPTRVMGVMPPSSEKALVTFTDGSTLKVHPHHEWTVYDRARAAWRTVETATLQTQSLFSGKRARFQLPLLASPLQFPTQALPLDPYLLGAWLGDGRSGQVDICGAAAVEILGAKHIPEIYQMASEVQRRSLLAGLVDADGSVEPITQRVRFVTCSRVLADGVARLVRSLGYRASLGTQRPALSSSGIQGKQVVFTVQWTPHDGQGGGTLARKFVTRIRRRRRIGIKSIEPCEPELGRCITVAREDGLYLVGDALLPTHNSMTASQYFPAWYLLNNPSKRIIIASYADSLAKLFGKRVRELVAEVGPWVDVPLSKDTRAADEWELAKHGGGIVAAGVGTGITGRGADLLLIDDPVKDAVEARSQAKRDAAWDWYLSTASSRLEPGANTILILTRWNEDDLAGRILKNDDEEEWEILNLPALAEENDLLGREVGEPLWPARYNKTWMEKRRRKVGVYWFSAMYQQRPSPEDGEVFHRHGVRYWTEKDGRYLLILANGTAVDRKPSECMVFFTMDLAVSESTSADFTVIGAWALTPFNELVLLDLYRARVAGPDQLPEVRRMAEKWRPSFIAIEDVQYQLSFVQSVVRSGLPGKRLKARGDKYGRALSAGVLWDDGKIFLPSNAGWAAEIIEECVSYPHGAHDDFVDVVAYAALEAAGYEGTIGDIYGIATCEECGNKYIDPDKNKPCPKCGAARLTTV